MADTDENRGMLEGIRVIDLTRVLAGPYATMLLADLGADVIKIEPPQGDPMRQMGPPFEVDGRSPYFMAVNRNKRSVVLDLRKRRQREQFLSLVDTADVVVDNFRPGVMDRLGISHEVLKLRKPTLVTCSLSAFGSNGPYAQLPAYDLVIQAMGGNMSITGEPGGDPVRAGVPIGDLAGGTFGAIAILGAVVSRQLSGEGRHIDLSLLDVQVSLLTYVAQYYFTNGKVPGPIGSGHQSVVPYQSFKTQDGYLVVAVFGDDFWGPLCHVLGISELAEKYPTNESRRAARDAVVRSLAERFVLRTTSEWITDLWTAGVPSGPVNDVAQVFLDPQVIHRGMLVTDGERRLVADPIERRGEGAYRRAPWLGEHNDEVLGETGS